MECSLVIPCYNEAPSIEKLLDRCKPLLDSGRFEVVLVNNGSTDSTSEIFAALSDFHPALIMVHVETNDGYGNGILAGLRVAKGDVLGWTHADLQADPHDALRGLDIFGDNPEAVFVKGRRHGRCFTDAIFTAGMSVFETLLLKTCMSDINAQPTMFHKSFFESWQYPPKDFALDLYAYYLAKKAGLKTKRFPVHFGTREFGTSSWNVSWAAKKNFIKRTVDFSLALRKNGAN